MPIQLDFIVRRWAAMAEDDPTLRERQPYKAAYERDHAWLGGNRWSSTTAATTAT